MTEDHTDIESKNLSKEEALQQYEKLFSQEAANIITAYRNMDRLLFLLKTLGYSQSEAITKMAKDAKEKGLKGFSEASIRRGLTDESKRNTKPGPRKSNQMISFQPNRRLVVPEEPKLPPPPEVVREAEIVREPPKPINEPIPIPTPKPYIIFRQKQWRDKYNWDTSHTLKLVLDNTRENIIDVRPMMEAKK